tara:strand:+ start:140 stop:1414 length:1275 start_codon:yes stop_codon:yes gene_type:complete
MKGFSVFVISFVLDSFLKMDWTGPTNHIATKEVDGAEVPSVDAGAIWYVEYGYRNPKTGKLEYFREKKGINRIKTVKERTAAIKILNKAVKRFLQDGYSPFTPRKVPKSELELEKKIYSTNEALTIAENAVKNTWKQSSREVNKVYLNSFKKWLKSKGFLHRNIKDLTKQNISFYLDYLINTKTLSNTSRNNHRAVLSGIFTQMAIKDIIPDNFFKYIPKLNAQAKKNRPYSPEVLIAIFKKAEAENTYLHAFMRFMWHSIMRPIDIVRVTVNDINLADRTIAVEVKKNIQRYIRITEPIYIYLQQLNLNQYNKTDFLFTKNEAPGPWKVEKEKSREDFFTRRFKTTIKDHFDLDKDQGLYSIRHNSALSQRKGLLEQGLTDYEMLVSLQEIMGHLDIKTTQIYLRNIGGSLPKDWSENFDVDL